jgi:TM2 domain-containing membrane protein YozV
MESTTIQTTSQKKKILFIILAILFGYLGLHNIYIGMINKGLFQLLVTSFLWFTVIVPLIIWIWSIYEVITIREDHRGLPLM